MKTIIGAFALFLASPAVAQPAPAADPHAGHQMPAQQGEKKDCCEKMKAEGKECCCKGMAGKGHDMKQHQTDGERGSAGQAGLAH